MTPDFAVLGRGLWGSAAAMYLARAGHSVALIGPPEPADPATADGPFASHHDAGRITRCIAKDTMWARASARSIANYAALSAESGIEFYTPCGGMMASDEPDYIGAVQDVAAAEGYGIDICTGPALAERFGMFRFAPGTVATWDATGGYIDPRAMRRAHETLAIRAGAAIVEDHATALSGERVSLASGSTVDAGHVVIATGCYAALDDLLPTRPDMIVCARTVYFAEVDTAEAERLAGMPSLIWRPAGLDHYHYLLPPIRYPDGRLLLKIGGEPNDRLVRTPAEARAWMQGQGSAEIARDLQDALLSLMPDLKIAAGHFGACILAHSPSGFPYIGRLNDAARPWPPPVAGRARNQPMSWGISRRVSPWARSTHRQSLAPIWRQAFTNQLRTGS